VPVILEPIQRGASGRTIVRVRSEGHEPFIGIHYTDEREDNENFVPVGRFLRKARLNVPEVLRNNPSRRVCLIQDLGGMHLLDLKGRPFEEREPYYRSALEQLDRLFYIRTQADFEFMPPFDESLYRWEQEYCFEYFVEGLLGMDAAPLREDPAFADLASKLGASHRHLVHRDFQSQNIMIHEDKAWLIDFQGMRRGRQEYDIASLVYDPYMDHDAEERERLLDLWEDIAEDRPEESLLNICATQRLMQALGAFGNIIMNRRDGWYRQHVAVAASHLRGLVAGTDLEDSLAPVLDKGESFS